MLLSITLLGGPQVPHLEEDHLHQAPDQNTDLNTYQNTDHDYDQNTDQNTYQNTEHDSDHSIML